MNKDRLAIGAAVGVVAAIAGLGLYGYFSEVGGNTSQNPPPPDGTTTPESEVTPQPDFRFTPDMESVDGWSCLEIQEDEWPLKKLRQFGWTPDWVSQIENRGDYPYQLRDENNNVIGNYDSWRSFPNLVYPGQKVCVGGEDLGLIDQPISVSGTIFDSKEHNIITKKSQVNIETT